MVFDALHLFSLFSFSIWGFMDGPFLRRRVFFFCFQLFPRHLAMPC